MSVTVATPTLSLYRPRSVYYLTLANAYACATASVGATWPGSGTVAGDATNNWTLQKVLSTNLAPLNVGAFTTSMPGIATTGTMRSVTLLVGRPASTAGASSFFNLYVTDGAGTILPFTSAWTAPISSTPWTLSRNSDGSAKVQNISSNATGALAFIQFVLSASGTLRLVTTYPASPAPYIGVQAAAMSTSTTPPEVPPTYFLDSVQGLSYVSSLTYPFYTSYGYQGVNPGSIGVNFSNGTFNSGATTNWRLGTPTTAVYTVLQDCPTIPSGEPPSYCQASIATNTYMSILFGRRGTATTTQATNLYVRETNATTQIPFASFSPLTSNDWTFSYDTNTGAVVVAATFGQTTNGYLSFAIRRSDYSAINTQPAIFTVNTSAATSTIGIQAVAVDTGSVAPAPPILASSVVATSKPKATAVSFVTGTYTNSYATQVRSSIGMTNTGWGLACSSTDNWQFSDLGTSWTTSQVTQSSVTSTTAIQSCTLFLGQQSGAYSNSTLIISLKQYVAAINARNNAAIYFDPSFTTLTSNGWTFAYSSGNMEITPPTSTPPDPSFLACVSFSVPLVLSYTTGVQVQCSFTTTQPAIGLQAVAVNNSTAAPAACFGGDTFIACSDGSLRRIRDFSGVHHVLAYSKDDNEEGTLPTSIAVRAYRRDTVMNPVLVGCVAQHVFVTKDHLVALVGRDRPAHIATPPDCMAGRFASCCWLAKDLEDFARTADYDLHGVFHLVPCDPAQRLHTVLVGSATGTCVAELYRSDESTLGTLNGFYAL